MKSFEIMSDHARTSQNEPKSVNFQRFDINTTVYTEVHAEFESGLRFADFGPTRLMFKDFQIFFFVIPGGPGAPLAAPDMSLGPGPLVNARSRIPTSLL